MADLWAISVRGPDDLIAAAGGLEAHRGAHRFNEAWLRRVETEALREDDPHMWASPILWPYSAEAHAESLRLGAPDYGGIFDEPKAASAA